MEERPTSIAAVQDLVQQAARPGGMPIVARGGGTKPALSMTPDGATALALDGLTGILAYEPEEYTFTARAGTAVADVAAALAENSQYLPFDPLLAAAGATLGGTVAANSSGSGRFRYGGVRDFILGAGFVDGQGMLVRSGGQVVKNSAGFDLAKFFVGSLGRYGILVELSFKVFPRPQAFQTLRLSYHDLEAALRATFRLAPLPFEMDAVDLLPGVDGCALLLRLGGRAAALPERVSRLRRFLQQETAAGETAVLQESEDAALWQEANHLVWAPPDAPLVKIPLAPKQAPALDACLADWPRRYSCAANVAWVAAKDAAAKDAAAPDAAAKDAAAKDVAGLDRTLGELGLVGLQLRGRASEPILGRRRGVALAQRVKQALDPDAVFGRAV
jgi:glycolate oxidase FAD binding subunit